MVAFTGCYKFEGSQTVPAYLKIDTVSINTYYPDQGTRSHKITDVWIYVNDNIVGAYELPANFPVLAEGLNKLEIRPGIKLNGISSTRVPYPFYEPIVYEDFQFVTDSTQVIHHPVADYYGNLVFAWMEDFEGAGLSLEENPASDTVIVRVIRENSPEPETKYAGAIFLTDENPIYSAASYNAYEMPRQGSPVLMELEWKSDNYLNTGLLIRDPGGYVKVPLLILKHAEEWNKIYINLGPNLSLHPQASEYRVYLEAGIDSDKDFSTIYIDNIKVIHRPI
ncbi:MAG: hypothetical protein P8100_02135 [bacterium]